MPTYQSQCVCCSCACSGKINLEYMGSTSDEYVFGNGVVATVKPQSGAEAAAAAGAVALQRGQLQPRCC
jgi:hypothetical protein